MNHVPEKSEVDTNDITVDPDTMSMLKELGMHDSPIIDHQRRTQPRRATLRESVNFLSAVLKARIFRASA